MCGQVSRRDQHLVERSARGVRRHGYTLFQIAEAAEQLRRALWGHELGKQGPRRSYLDRLIEEALTSPFMVSTCSTAASARPVATHSARVSPKRVSHSYNVGISTVRRATRAG